MDAGCVFGVVAMGGCSMKVNKTLHIQSEQRQGWLALLASRRGESASLASHPTTRQLVPRRARDPDD